MSGVTAPVVELFSGIQGEGLHVGERHLFLRLAGCAFGCAYCDQPEAARAPKFALIEKTPGRRDFVRVKNPLSPEQTAEFISRLAKPGLHQALAATGGEPLHHAGFLKKLLPSLRAQGWRILLETNGTLPDELRALRGLLNIISMDIKLRSATGRPMPARAHERFARESLSAEEFYVKAVVAAATTPGELRRAARLVARVDTRIPLILQPMTASGRKAPAPEQILALQETALEILPDTRVIPQTHKLMRQR